MVLFADSSGLDVRRWTKEPSLSGRLLGIGLPLTMVAGAVVAALVFAGVELWQAALIGVMLAPTDAALGQAVVANPRVPASFGTPSTWRAASTTASCSPS